MAAEEANLVVREGVWVENADFGITLLHLHLVERSILVYGKWGQFGHLEGARGGHVVCLNPLIWRLLGGAFANFGSQVGFLCSDCAESDRIDYYALTSDHVRLMAHACVPSSSIAPTSRRRFQPQVH